MPQTRTSPLGTAQETPVSRRARSWRLSLLIALPVPMVALVVGLILELASGQASPFDVLSYPLLAGILTLLTLLLVFRQDSVGFVVLATTLGASSFFLAKLVYLLYYLPEGFHVQTEMTESLFWLPAIYVLSSLVPDIRGGRIIAVCLFGAVFAAGLFYALPNLLAGDNLGVVHALLQLNAANLTFMGLTRVFSHILDSSIRNDAHLETLEHLAFTDVLTRLPNRLRLEQVLVGSIVEASESNSLLALLFIDIDGFKLINDTLGHEIGDRLLIAVGDRLQQSSRQGDVLGRISGDEFVLISKGAVSEAEIDQLAKRFVDALGMPFSLGGQLLHVSVSIGVSVFPADGQSPATLLKHADSAMYQVKKSGKNNYKRYLAESDAVVEAHKELERDFSMAFNAKELSVRYQPLFDLHSGRLVKVESLLRWKHPVHGFIEPARFIPIAESSGQILPIGQWLMEESCKQVRDWQLSGFDGLALSVNVSPLQFSQPGFVKSILDTLDLAGLEPHSLELELTESIVMHNLENVQTALAALRREGVRVAIDDFGTGYSSLSYLRNLNIDTLKIDRGFIAGLGSARKSPQYALALAQAIIGIAQSLDLEIVAEGIENEAQLELLRDMGCHLGQGYYFTEALAVADFAKTLEVQPETWLKAEPLVSNPG